LASFEKEFELSGGTYTVDVHDVLADDNHAVALLRSTAPRDARTLDMDYVLVLHIDDRKITEGWEFWICQASVAEFWS
jgi:uncharacterized protein